MKGDPKAALLPFKGPRESVARAVRAPDLALEGAVGYTWLRKPPRPLSRISMKSKSQGFTLIELMVVVSIIALLAVAILPAIVESEQQANQAVDKLNLGWQFNTVRLYKQRYKTAPRGGGHKFILDPWVRNVIEHTAQNRDRYFSPQAIADGDERYAELKQEDPETIWKDRDSLDSMDTNWAGLAGDKKKGMWSGKVIWMATDNEGGNVYPDGSVVIMNGDGATSVLLRDPDLAAHGYSADADEEEHIEVGPNSRHPKLAKLEH